MLMLTKIQLVTLIIN